MKEMGLLTRETVLKEEFNTRDIKVNNVTDFLMYFASVLQIGVELELIDESMRNSIGNMITYAISHDIVYDENDEFSEKHIQIANYMYVITLYLKELSLWEAWQELTGITSKDLATNFIIKVKSWFRSNIKKQVFILNGMKTTILKLNINNIIQYYNSLIKVADDFYNFNSLRINLKMDHNSLFQYGNYIFVKDVRSFSNCYEKFCVLVYDFCMEVSIMETIGAKRIIDEKEEEALLIYAKQKGLVESINKEFEEKLNILKNEYLEKLQIYFKSLHRPGRKRKGCRDEVEIERNYCMAKTRLEKEWNDAIIAIERKYAITNENQMDILEDSYLVDIIKEFAIFSLANRNVISYPATSEERGKMLFAIDINKAIEEFIQFNDSLTSEQVNFLRNVS